jgi:hypothetical protein
MVKFCEYHRERWACILNLTARPVTCRRCKLEADRVETQRAGTTSSGKTEEYDSGTFEVEDNIIKVLLYVRTRMALTP